MSGKTTEDSLQIKASGIAWIDHHAALKAIVVPVSDDMPEGEAVDDNELFEELETEMMKRGTLAHGTIRWDFVVEQAGELLRTQSKDLRLITFILQALPQAPSVVSPLPLAAHIVARFISLWGDKAHPSGRNRGRQLTRIVDTLDTMVTKAVETGLDADLRETTMTAMMMAGEALAEISSDLGMRMAALVSRVEKAAEAVLAEEPVRPPAPASNEQGRGDSAAGSETAPQVFTPAAPLKPEKLQLDAANERGLKQSLTTVADFLLELDMMHPLSYRVRRFATWYGISGPPPIKAEERTVIQPVSEDVADGYRTAVERKQSDSDIVKRLERSCHLQPFWLEGQYLAWRLAKALARDRVAEAIAEEATRFAGASLWLKNLQFSDGAPFLPDDVRTWLDTVRFSSSNGGGSATDDGESHSGTIDQDMMHLVEEARSVADGGDMASAIQLLDTTRTTFSSPRSATIWELLTMECLSGWGMKAHVAAQASRLEAAVADVRVADWDKDILDRIKRLKSDNSIG